MLTSHFKLKINLRADDIPTHPVAEMLRALVCVCARVCVRARARVCVCVNVKLQSA